MTHPAARSPHPRRLTRFTAAIVITLAGAWPAGAAELQPRTVEDWQRYVRATEARIDRELASDQRFLGIDFEEASKARADRQTVLSGQVVLTRMAEQGHNAEQINVRGGLINHWRGTIFVPSVSLDQVLQELRSPAVGRHKQQDVLESKVLSREGDTSRVYLKLVRKKIVTVTYNTEHEVRYRRLTPTRAASRSVSTKIAEVENAGTPSEREKPIGNDRGFMWRLNSYWRFLAVPGGVVVECESVSLSRDIPTGLGWLVGPFVNSIPRESLEQTLVGIRNGTIARTRAASPATSSVR